MKEIENRVLEVIEECFYRTPRIELEVQITRQSNLRGKLIPLRWNGEFFEGLKYQTRRMLQSKLKEFNII